MEGEQVDINNVFTESDLYKAIYMYPPEGYKV